MQTTPRNHRFRAFAAAIAFVLVGAGCDAPVPAPQPPAEAQFDVSTTTCPEIPAARAKLMAAYTASVKAANDTYQDARKAFQADLDSCLDGIWKGGPCDAEYAATQTAYKNAWGDISNDQFYKEWKQAKPDWDACYGNYAQKQQEWVDRNKGKEQLCRDEFQAKVAAAGAAHDAALDAAKKKRDADNAFLTELEKTCAQQKAQNDAAVAVGAVVPVSPGNSGSAGGKAVAVGTTYQPQAAACQTAVPGENTPPRQGKASDFGPKDVMTNLLVSVAEEVTKTPVPISAIHERVFAAMVTVKIRDRLAQMEYEWIDAAGDNRAQRRIEQNQARYRRALSAWGAIAEGRMTVPQAKTEANAINALPSGACKTDADCGTPICCSAREVGTMKCNVSTGACVPNKSTCAEPKVCGGSPASCVNPPRVEKGIRVSGKDIPLSQVHAYTGDECDDEEHWHANAGSAKATDGSAVPEHLGDCGYGKTKDVPVIDITIPAGN